MHCWGKNMTDYEIQHPPVFTRYIKQAASNEPIKRTTMALKRQKMCVFMTKIYVSAKIRANCELWTVLVLTLLQFG